MGLIAKEQFQDKDTGVVYKRNKPIKGLSKEREKYLKDKFPYLVKDDGVQEPESDKQDAKKEENATKKKTEGTDAPKK